MPASGSLAATRTCPRRSRSRRPGGWAPRCGRRKLQLELQPETTLGILSERECPVHDPPIGIEPMTYALREPDHALRRCYLHRCLRQIAQIAPSAQGRTGHSFQISSHVPGHGSRRSVTEGDDKAQLPPGLTHDTGERAWHLPQPHAAPALTSATMLSAGTGQPSPAGHAAVVPERNH
jgi:hypothetical protein